MEKILIAFGAILSTLNEVHPDKAPGGILYAGVQEVVSLDEYNLIMLTMVSQGLVSRTGECYTITDKGRAKADQIDALLKT